MQFNWANFLFLKHDGYGRLGRHFAQSLIRNGHDVYPFTIDELDMPSWYQRSRGLSFDRVTVQLMPPHNMRHLAGRSMGFTMHESMTLPPGWVDHINNKCEWLIVPSQWLVDLFTNGGVKLPIRVVPGGINPDECPILPQSRNRPFTFGCLGDRGGRKGHMTVWTAFYKVFAHTNKDVRLLIKCRPGSMPSNLDFSYSTDSRMTIWKADVDEIADIYAQMDAFIFPTKCEGLGMPPRESAACGIPTVVTRFSGTADDCDHWAIPIDNHKLVESHMQGSGGLWAEPSLDEVCEKMLWLYEHQDEAKANAVESAQWLRQNATMQIAADKLVNTLGELLGGPRTETPKPVKYNSVSDLPNFKKLTVGPELAHVTNGHKLEGVK